MFPAENLWLCIAVPAFIVTSLVFIKFAQLRINRQAKSPFGRNGIRTRKVSISKPMVLEEHPAPMRNDQQGERKPDIQDRPENCQKYLGYLYMRQGQEKTYIPTECYDCRRLLQCMYSPNVIEKVYG